MPSRAARARDTVDLPEPAGPSMAMTGRAADLGAGTGHRRARLAKLGQGVGEARVAGGHRLPSGDGGLARRRRAGRPGHGGGHGHPVVAAGRRPGPGRSGPPAPRPPGRPPRRWPRPPKARTSSAVPARRSDSFTRSSPTSRNRVVPTAAAAATARMGTSSREGISAASTTVPCRSAGVAGHRPGPVAGLLHLDGGPHPAQHAEEAQALDAQVDVGHRDQAAGDDHARHHPEGRLGGIAGHGVGARRRRRAPAHPDHPAAADPLEGDVGTGGGQHLLGVGPGGHRLV